MLLMLLILILILKFFRLDEEMFELINVSSLPYYYCNGYCCTIFPGTVNVFVIVE